MKNLNALIDRTWDLTLNQMYDVRLSSNESKKLLNDVKKRLANNPTLVFSYIAHQIYGNHDSSWLSFCDFFKTECKTDLKINGLLNLCKHSGWWTPYKTIAFLQHKPDFIKTDEQKLLHCDNGPAIKYRDGFSVYAWHGIRIPEEWIEDKSSITVQTALEWKNVEQRRVACELLGWEKIIKNTDATVIDEDGDLEIGTLIEIDIPEIGKEKFLKVRCGTGRFFVLPVPPYIKTALSAQCWMWNVKDYKPEIRT